MNVKLGKAVQLLLEQYSRFPSSESYNEYKKIKAYYINGWMNMNTG